MSEAGNRDRAGQLRRAVQAARAKAKQDALTRGGLARVATSEEIIAAMVELGNLFEAFEELLEQRLDHLDAQLAAITAKLEAKAGG